MFSYQALGEKTLVGKYLTKKFYGMSDDEKVYTYYEGCSDGGREGMSQVQRYGAEYDGVIAGAPAFRFAQQQVLHVFPAEVEYTMGYVPPSCAIETVVNKTIEACDSLDGRSDGVISRTDLCKLQFNLSSLIGESYYCAESTQATAYFSTTSGSTTTPEQNGTITEEDIKVIEQCYDGIFNSAGERAYFSFQHGSSLSDAEVH
ncbi:unnamed protein product [Ambrosiozyma monospora]|uniref:Unnamed protein product n=1 Tax=Ambrosiozyma monospora TaxID=43982 RepID=A0ACB5U871_AMBMO|nr:unnamed protein product [Ambrosiozyma monospora]